MVFNDIFSRAKQGITNLYNKTKDFFGDIKKRGTTLLTGGNFCGPGNNLDSDYIARNPPKNNVDKACMFHDKDYENIARQRDSGNISQNEAKSLIRESDNRLISNINQYYNESPYMATVSRLGIQAKNKLEDWGILDPNTFVSV